MVGTQVVLYLVGTSLLQQEARLPAQHRCTSCLDDSACIGMLWSSPFPTCLN